MILVNGEAVTHVSVEDRGLLYGDGLFETIAVRDGRPILWQRHMQRLISGCTRLAIPQPDSQLLWDEALTVCKEVQQAVLKIIITRGISGRGYRPDATEIKPTRIITLHPWPDYPPEFTTHGVSVRLCTNRLGSNPALAGVKHLNRLEQIMARSEWHDHSIQEGFMLNSTGHVIEGTMSNVFMVREGVVITPDLSECGVPGIIRAEILEQVAAWSIPCDITAISVEELMAAQEVFLCNSIIGIWPVRAFTGIHFPVGSLTQRIITHLDELFTTC